MTLFKRTALVLLFLVTAACTSPDRFGAGAGDGSGLGANAAGSVSDPTSPLFFNQTIGDRVLFTVNTSTITPEGKAILEGQAQWLLTNSDYRAVIEGHADERGTREYNLALGQRRANAVREYLVSRGVPNDRLQVTSFGKERPVAVCSAESCYAQNRRAVTVLSFSAMTS